MSIQRARFDASRLMADHPPVLQSEQKRRLFELVAPLGTAHGGALEVTRYPVKTIEAPYDPNRWPRLRVEPGVFAYERSPNAVDWYLNFAHHDLFCVYGSALMAQDELQVAEHPALAALREALLVDPVVTPLTVEGGCPTPVLIKNVERCAAIDSRSIYGHAFAGASESVMTAAVERLEPPPTSNILAIEAPFGHRGRYTSLQIDYILETAYTGFDAAVQESDGARTVIHTGFWGCGAYGGNRILMPMLQLAAAQLAGVDEFVFYAVDRGGSRDFERARETLKDLLTEPVGVSRLRNAILGLGFEWGVSNGT